MTPPTVSIPGCIFSFSMNPSRSSVSKHISMSLGLFMMSWSGMPVSQPKSSCSDRPHVNSTFLP